MQVPTKLEVPAPEGVWGILLPLSLEWKPCHPSLRGLNQSYCPRSGASASLISAWICLRPVAEEGSDCSPRQTGVWQPSSWREHHTTGLPSPHSGAPWSRLARLGLRATVRCMGSSFSESKGHTLRCPAPPRCRTLNTAWDLASSTVERWWGIQSVKAITASDLGVPRTSSSNGFDSWLRNNCN